MGSWGYRQFSGAVGRHSSQRSKTVSSFSPSAGDFVFQLEFQRPRAMTCRAAFRFGFWRLQTRLPAKCEVQVFPDALAGQKHLGASLLSGRLCPARSPDGRRTGSLEKNLAVGLMLARLAEWQGDRFSFFAYSDRVRCLLRAAFRTVTLQRLPMRALSFGTQRRDARFLGTAHRHTTAFESPLAFAFSDFLGRSAFDGELFGERRFNSAAAPRGSHRHSSPARPSLVRKRGGFLRG